MRGDGQSQCNSQWHSDLGLQRRTEFRVEFRNQSRRDSHPDSRFGCRVEFGSELPAELAAECPSQGSNERRNPGSSPATRAAARAIEARVFCGCPGPPACFLQVVVCWPPNTILPWGERTGDCLEGSSRRRCQCRSDSSWRSLPPPDQNTSRAPRTRSARPLPAGMLAGVWPPCQLALPQSFPVLVAVVGLRRVKPGS